MSIEVLPENCISEIISHSSPSDAIRSSAVSRDFNSAADSDIVWERFLPSDYKHILSTSKSSSPSLINSTKKEIYYSLCDSPVVLEGGTKSFFLHKSSGKKCYMLGARDLSIAWGDDTSEYWIWKPHHGSRFQDVAELKFIWSLDIRGKIETRTLSPKTTYSAYFVFKLVDNRSAAAYDLTKSTIRLVDYETVEESEWRARPVCLVSEFRGDAQERESLELPRNRKDGWMEAELGEFYSGDGDDGEVEARLMEIKQRNVKTSLIVEGIEFRPKADRSII